jgi:hypothetical protein
MNRPLTALFAAFEALLVVGVGVGIPLVPLTLLWAVQYGFAVDWADFWRASVDTWLVGHGVDLQITLDSALAASLGVPEGTAFPVTIAALGFALLTVLLALRAGRRVGETRYRGVGSIAALGTFVLLTTGVTLSAVNPFVRPSITQGILLPTLVFAISFTIGLERTRRAEGDDNGSSIRDWIADWPTAVRGLVRTALLGGTAAVAGILAVSGVLVALLVGVSYAQVITLYESLHAEVVGGAALTLGQLAVLPNIVVWAASWLVGPGFAIGAGSSVSPVATALGPVPSVPLLGALPTGDLPFGFLGLAVPVVLAFIVGALLYARVADDLDYSPLWMAGTGLAIGAVGGVLLGLLAWWSSGAAGPGRLAQVGPDPLPVALFGALEIGLAATAGLFVASRRDRA